MSATRPRASFREGWGWVVITPCCAVITTFYPSASTALSAVEMRGRVAPATLCAPLFFLNLTLSTRARALGRKLTVTP